MSKDTCVYGVATYGIGKYRLRPEGSSTKYKNFSVWENMISRCYYERNPRYRCYGLNGVTVCDKWLNFQNFAKWFDINYIKGWYLDKDILGNGKLYSPEYCTFVPREINNMLIIRKKNRRKNGLILPQGVIVNRNKYIARVGQYTCGSFDNVEDASNSYLEHKIRLIKELAEKYKELLEKGVYNKLISDDIGMRFG